MVRFLIWDFDETLGYRVGRWASALHAVLQEARPDQDFDRELLGAQLRDGFPWHTPEAPHPELSLPDSWWDALLPIFVGAFEASGLDPSTSEELAGKVRDAYVDPRHWRLFDDAVPALRGLSSRGWTHLILSNLVPELSGILHNLGLDGRHRREGVAARARAVFADRSAPPTGIGADLWPERGGALYYGHEARVFS